MNRSDFPKLPQKEGEELRIKITTFLKKKQLLHKNINRKNPKKIKYLKNGQFFKRKMDTCIVNFYCWHIIPRGKTKVNKILAKIGEVSGKFTHFHESGLAKPDVI